MVNKGILLQIFTNEEPREAPHLDFDCWYKRLRPSTLHLYPKTNLLSVRQQEEVTHGRNRGLTLQQSLGSL